MSEYVDGLESVSGPRVYAPLLAKSASVRAFFLPHFGRYYAEHVGKLVGLMQAGDLRVEIDERPFEGVGQVVEAVEHLHSGPRAARWSSACPEPRAAGGGRPPAGSL